MTTRFMGQVQSSRRAARRLRVFQAKRRSSSRAGTRTSVAPAAFVALLHRLPALGHDGTVHVVVESPRGAAVKLKYEPSLGVMTMGRALPAGLTFPFDFGFVPGTHAEDGDPLDAMIVADHGTWPGVVVACRPIGVLRASQREKGARRRVRNDRVLFVGADDAARAHLDDVHDLGKRLRDELVTFFEAAVAFEGKALEILGWSGASVARETVGRAIASFGEDPS